MLKPRNKAAAAVLAAAVLPVFTAAPADASLVFYEDFNDLTAGNASLDGQGGWTSAGDSLKVRSGNFTAGSSGIWDGTVSGSPTSGGNFIAADGSDDGLGFIVFDAFQRSTFSAGSTTWLSYTEYNGNNGSNGRQNIAIGAAPLTALDGNSMAGDGIGVATSTGNTARAAYWDAATGENAAASSIGSGRPIFVMAKIVWSDTGNDTITVKRWNQSTGIPANLQESDWDALTELSTTSADLDQSTFDTLSIATRYAWFDEIRIATDFDSAVTGTVVVPEPTSLASLALGLFLLARRRRG